MQSITTHHVPNMETVQNFIGIYSIDTPDPSSGVHRVYQIRYPEYLGENRCVWKTVTLSFQDGDPTKVGINGITNEALLAILLDRLEAFQKGSFACQENQDALGCLKDAMAYLQDRTKKRKERGVKGQQVL